jgi:competence protein ComEC
MLGPLWSNGAVLLVEQMGVLTEWTLGGLKALAAWDLAAIWVGPPRWWIWLPWSAGLLLFLGARRWRFLFLSLLLLGSMGLFDRAFSRASASGNLKLSVLDVGQGDALLLELPDGSALLVDGGGIPYGDFDIGEKVVLPELLRRGIRELRAMVLTHPDADHVSGLISLARHLKVHEFWTASRWSFLGEVPELKKILQEKNIPIRSLDNHQTLSAARTSFEVLWPPSSEQLQNQDLSRNDQSLVLRVCHEKVCFLLTGDLEARGEALLLERWQQNGAVKSQVLKVGHHGSRTSTHLEFLTGVDPQYALISAGKDNRFGMPHREVLQRLEERGVKWLSTERVGQIQVETDGREIFIEGLERAVAGEPDPAPRPRLGPAVPTPSY